MSAETSIQANIDEAEIMPVWASLADPERRELAERHSLVSARMLAYIKGVVINPNSLFDDIDLQVENIVAGASQDYRLEVSETAITAQHTLADHTEVGSPGAYGGDIRTGMIITANGIAMGYNDQTSGNWVNAVAISSIGNVTILGTLEAGSIISNTATIDGVDAVDVKDNAATGSTHAAVTGSNPHNTPMSTVTGDLDDISDGSTYFRSTASQNTGATRAVNALDSAYDYIRTVSTTKIAVSGSNPANGLVIDSSGIRGYQSSTLTLNISTAGTSTWSGDIITAGQVKSTGSVSGTGGTGTIVGQSTSGSVYGVIGSNTAGLYGVLGYGNLFGIGGWAYENNSSAVGISGISTYAAGSALSLSNNGGGTEIKLGSSGIITNDADFEDDVNIQGTLDVDGTTTINGNLVLGTSDFTRALNTTNGRITIYNQTTPFAAIATYRYAFQTG